MFKIKKKIEKPKLPVLYNVIEDYSEADAPGNVTACAMTLPEDLAGHAKILSESYGVPLATMTELLTQGGVYVYPAEGGLLTRGTLRLRVRFDGPIAEADVCVGSDAVCRDGASGPGTVAFDG